MVERFSRLAEEIVAKNLIKTPTEEKRVLRGEAGLRKQAEFQERLKSVKDFMKHWNFWRRFYFDLPPIEPKTSGQLTTIEKCIDFAKDNDMNLSVLIGVVHKGFEYRRFKPNYNSILLYGEELYEKFHSRVTADIDQKEYEKRALNRD